ncbi:MAG: rod shape-determining protein RodA [Candidatus Melainabacteria bacterium RIFCSPHIGHO2_02_FULL_34_12]|nr:MAG: rod shape-determining protein RodA [Candidatus Melainabacteria bacterium RIFCSPHIGHO2_02_FULL_34_12]
MQLGEERDFIIRRWSDIVDLDWYILLPTIVLIIINLLLLKSAVFGTYLSRQFFFLIPAVLFGLAALFLKISFWQKNTRWIYLANIVLLFIVLLKGASAMGAQRWIDVGFIKIQPSEVAKIAIIISLAAWFVKHPLKNYIDIFLSALIIAPPFLLIFKQPDLGTSLAFIAIYLGMAFWSGASVTHLLVVVSPIVSLILNACGAVVLNMGTMQIHNKIIELNITLPFVLFLFFMIIWLVINHKPWESPWIVLSVSSIIFLNFMIGFIRPILWNFLQAYQQRRLTIFLNPESDPQGAGYHIIQSILAIGNGGFFGYGWQHGRLTKGSYVPAQHTDFVFSIAGEEFGFIGSAFIVIMFAIILWRTLYIARHSNDKFASLIAIGIFSFLSFHIFVNIGMTLGIMPITGVPLPFLSYGGTALVIDLFAIFFLLSISWRTLPRKLF